VRIEGGVIIEDKEIKEFQESGFDGRNQVLMKGIRY
jgi:hypothetical protein